MATESANREPGSGWNLSILSPARGSRHRRKRLGFGEASGKGKTCGKGNKGAKSRSGFHISRGYEGGQSPLHRRLPKVGFTSRKRVAEKNVYQLVSIAMLNRTDSSGELTLDKLFELKLIRNRRSKVKILGGGELKRHVVIEAHAASASAREAVEKAGGEIRIQK